MTIISAEEKSTKKNPKQFPKQSETVFGLSAICRVLKLFPDVRARCIVVLAFKKGHVRGKSFHETGVKNGWRWQWAERKIDDENIGQFILAKNMKLSVMILSFSVHFLSEIRAPEWTRLHRFASRCRHFPGGACP